MHNNNSSHFYSTSKRGPRRTWRAGDIAFLKTCRAFNRRDHNDLIASGYLHEQATCHPVIILEAHATGAIITPVTAFGSSAENKFLPPWQQANHRRKSLDDFRAFVGTRRPDNRHSSLQLADPKMRMPKPQASWVYLRHFWTVPYTVLGWFNKTPGLLQIAEDSLAQLKQDIKQKYDDQLRYALDRLDASPATIHTPAPAAKNSHPSHPPQPTASASAPAPTPQAVLQVAWSHTADIRRPDPPLGASSQQPPGKAVMTYSKVVSGTWRPSGAVVTQVASTAPRFKPKILTEVYGPKREPHKIMSTALVT